MVYFRSLQSWIFIAFVSFFCTSCTSSETLHPPQHDEQATITPIIPNEDVTPKQKYGSVRNIIEAGDILSITVHGEENLSGTYPVDENGNIDLPLIGKITIQGLTLPQADASLTTLYGDGYLKNPSLAITKQDKE